MFFIKMETLVPDAVNKGESLADVKKRAKLDTGQNIPNFFRIGDQTNSVCHYLCHACY